MESNGSGLARAHILMKKKNTRQLRSAVPGQAPKIIYYFEKFSQLHKIGKRITGRIVGPRVRKGPPNRPGADPHKNARPEAIPVGIVFTMWRSGLIILL